MEYIIMFVTHILKACEAIAADGLPPLSIETLQSYAAYLLKLCTIYSSVAEQFIERFVG